MKTYTVDVTIEIEVIVDESKFTKEFMDEFNRYITPFDSIDDHVKHIAWCRAVGIITSPSDDFLEGYMVR
ncbi:hypothetical protein KAR91_63835 [Candidatus Pacearchaeota archaeon]|nr:hypothetical protein [Candidatus Pacearchaeota archaeon]